MRRVEGHCRRRPLTAPVRRYVEAAPPDHVKVVSAFVRDRDHGGVRLERGRRVLEERPGDLLFAQRAGERGRESLEPLGPPSHRALAFEKPHAVEWSRNLPRNGLDEPPLLRICAAVRREHDDEHADRASLGDQRDGAERPGDVRRLGIARPVLGPLQPEHRLVADGVGERVSRRERNSRQAAVDIERADAPQQLEDVAVQAVHADARRVEHGGDLRRRGNCELRRVEGPRERGGQRVQLGEARSSALRTAARLLLGLEQSRALERLPRLPREPANEIELTVGEDPSALERECDAADRAPCERQRDCKP
jgi:hypothetical protein